MWLINFTFTVYRLFYMWNISDMCISNVKQSVCYWPGQGNKTLLDSSWLVSNQLEDWSSTLGESAVSIDQFYLCNGINCKVQWWNESSPVGLFGSFIYFYLFILCSLGYVIFVYVICIYALLYLMVCFFIWYFIFISSVWSKCSYSRKWFLRGKDWVES